LQYFAFACFLFGLKLWVIHTFGNATPSWDQWDSEWDNLYRPYLNGTLTWQDLFILVNEHRILLTRLLNLAELELNGIWNPLLQMVINAGIHIAVILFIVSRLTVIIGRKHLPALLIFSAVLFGVPFAYENTLAAFQSQFYFVLFFSVLSLWLTVTHSPLSLRWWFGVGAGVMAFLSLASGVFALAASAAIGFGLFLLEIHQASKKELSKQLVAVGVLGGLFVLGVVATPTLAHHAHLKASSVMQFVDAMVAILAWPAEMGYLSALIRNLPGLILIGQILKSRPPATDRRWILVTMIIWTFGTAVGVAYGRAAGPTASRYLDIFVISILVNFACLLEISGRNILARPRLLTTMWVLAIFAALGIRAVNKLPQELAEKSATGQAQEVNVRNYLATGEVAHLYNKPFLHVPYPDPNRLIALLGSPQLRAILPSNLTRSSGNIEATSTQSKEGGRLDGFCNLLLENFVFFIGLGLCISLGLVVLVLRTERSN
jgi:hypothetical protein